MINRPWPTKLLPLSRSWQERLSIKWLSRFTKVSAAALAIAAIMLVNAGDPDNLAAACYGLALFTCGYLWFKFTATDAAASQFVPNLFAVGFAVRSLAAVAISVVAKTDVAYDDMYYELYGREWADYWRHLTITRPLEMFPSEHLYSQIVGLQYFVSNNCPLVPDLTNAFVGSLIPIVAYGIARRHFGGENVGRAAGLFAVLQTSMIVWSAIAMRDIIIIFFLSLVLREVVDMVSGLKVLPIVRSLIWLAAIYAFRPYVVIFTLISVGIAYTLILSKKSGYRFMVVLTFVGLISAVLLVGGIRNMVLSVVQSQTEQLSSTRQVIQYSDAHAYGSDVHFNSLLDIIEFLPEALYNFWAGPILFGYPLSQALVGLNGVLSWYITYWFAIKGYLKLRANSTHTVPLFVYIVVGSVLLSIICGNWAECVRLRSMLSVPIEIMAGVGWVRRKERTVNFAAVRA